MHGATDNHAGDFFVEDDFDAIDNHADYDGDEFFDAVRRAKDVGIDKVTIAQVGFE